MIEKSNSIKITSGKTKRKKKRHLTEDEIKEILSIALTSLETKGKVLIYLLDKYIVDIRWPGSPDDRELDTLSVYECRIPELALASSRKDPSIGIIEILKGFTARGIKWAESSNPAYAKVK